MRQYVIGLVVTDVLRAVFSFITSGRHSLPQKTQILNETAVETSKFHFLYNC